MAARKKKGVEVETFRRLALELPNASEAPHFDRIAFKTPRRTFATLAGDGTDVNFMLDPEHQAIVIAAHPDMFAPVAGGWGKMGATRCVLADVDPKALERVLVEAHARANAPRPRAKKKTK